MTRAEPCSVAVLVATADRPGLLASRALPSIGRQSRPPSRVVVVDDCRDGAACRRTGRAVGSWHPAGVDVTLLRNCRTKDPSGAWNTGLAHLLRTCGDPAKLYVAILDDDDGWESGHLDACLGLAGNRNLDVIAAPFLRIEEGGEPVPVFPPQRLEATEFLAGNPGIQASNPVCRLSVLLEAGLFDEALPSCTDRDLCIRVADLPGVRYGATLRPTVRHHACRSRPRLSTPASVPRLAGLDGFFRKYRGRMTDTGRARFRTRAQALFNWQETPPEPVDVFAVQEPSAAPQGDGSSGDPVHLVAGTVADTGRMEDLRGLLADLHGLAGDPGLSGLDVLVLENGARHGPGGGLRALVERERAQGLRIHPIYRTHPAAGAGGRLPIAHARSELQAHLHVFARRRPGAVVWILDDDMRPGPAGCRGRRAAVAPAAGARARAADAAPPARARRRRYCRRGLYRCAAAALRGERQGPAGRPGRLPALVRGARSSGRAAGPQRGKRGPAIRPAGLLLRPVARRDGPAGNAVLGHAGVPGRTGRRGLRAAGRHGRAHPRRRAAVPAARGRNRRAGSGRRR